MLKENLLNHFANLKLVHIVRQIQQITKIQGKSKILQIRKVVEIINLTDFHVFANQIGLSVEQRKTRNSSKNFDSTTVPLPKQVPKTPAKTNLIKVLSPGAKNLRKHKRQVEVRFIILKS